MASYADGTATSAAASSGLGWGSWVAIALAGLCVVSIGVLSWLIFRTWRLEASVKAQTQGRISLAAGASFAGVSASAAAILGGPGVVVVHFRSRELFRRTASEVTLDALLAFVDDKLSQPPEPETRAGRLAARAKEWALARTDVSELPGLGLAILGDLRDPSLSGSLVCGFSDPGTTGKAAAILYPVAGVIAPLGDFAIQMDWSGRNRIDGDLEASCGVVPARILREVARFSRRHVSLRRRPVPPAPSSTTLPVSMTT